MRRRYREPGPQSRIVLSREQSCPWSSLFRYARPARSVPASVSARPAETSASGPGPASPSSVRPPGLPLVTPPSPEHCYTPLGYWVMVLDDLQAVLDEAKALGPSAFADAESLAVMERQLAQFDCLVTSSVACFDAAGNFEASGAINTKAWLKAECRLSGKQAGSQVKRGRHLRRLPQTAEAFASGQLSGDQVDVLIGADKDSTHEALVDQEQELVEQGIKLPHHQFVQYMNYWRHRADREGAEDQAEQRCSEREVYLVQSFQDMWLGQMTLDPVSGAIVGGELHRLEQQLFEAEWAEAKERLGREPLLAELSRTPGQRRADALVEMATRSKASNDGRRPAPLFTVLVDYESLHGRLSQLEDGTVLPPGTLLPWLMQADLERATFKVGGRVEMGAPSKLATMTPEALRKAVFTPQGRKEVSSTARLFTGATRRAIEVRDRTCAHPTCDIPASRCQIDHIQPWSQGGETTQENGRLLCGRHNRMRNQREPPRRE